MILRRVDNNLTMRLVSAVGYGAKIRVPIDENGTIITDDSGNLVDGNYTLVGGSGYALSDLIVAPAPYIYEAGSPSLLRARLNDPLNEIERVEFFGNGVPLSGTASAFGDEATLTFTPQSEALSFLSVRPIYGDLRDGAPDVMPSNGFEASLFDQGRSSEDRSTWDGREIGNSNICMAGTTQHPLGSGMA